MDRYCLETDFQRKTFIVHNQRCTLYHDAHRVSTNLALDLGEYAHRRNAVQQARELHAVVRPCRTCLEELDA